MAVSGATSMLLPPTYTVLLEPTRRTKDKVLPQQPVGWLLERTTGALLVLVHRLAVTDRGKAVVKECRSRARAHGVWNVLLAAGQERSSSEDQDRNEGELPPTKNPVTVKNC